MCKLAWASVVVLGLGSACSSSSDSTNDAGAKDVKNVEEPAVDQLAPDAAVKQDSSSGNSIVADGSPDDLAADVTQPVDPPPSCGPGIYPCAPYGTKVGDVVEHLSLKGYTYPNYLCQDNQVPNTNALTLLSFKKWYQGDPVCPDKRQVLWIMVGAGWCKGCKEEHKQVQSLYEAGELDSRIALLSLVTAPEKSHQPMTEAFLKLWVNGLKLTFPAVMDETLKISYFVDLDALPYNLVIDLTTMKILVSTIDLEVPDIIAEIDTFLGNL